MIYPLRKSSLIPSPATSTGKRGRERNKLMAAGLVPARNVFSFNLETTKMQGYRLYVGARRPRSKSC